MNNEITALLEVVSALEDRAAEALGIPTALVKVEILHISFLVVDHSLRESSPAITLIVKLRPSLQNSGFP